MAHLVVTRREECEAQGGLVGVLMEKHGSSVDWTRPLFFTHDFVRAATVVSFEWLTHVPVEFGLAEEIAAARLGME